MIASENGVNLPYKLYNAKQISDATLCGNPNMACINRSCNDCGIQKLDEILEPLNGLKKISVTWLKWRNVQVSNKTTAGTSKKKSKPVLKKSKFHKEFEKQNGTLQELIEEMKASVETLSLHLFNYKWQYSQFNQIKKNLPEKTLLMVIDFAENYRTIYQREVQSGRWAYHQVTLHPVVCYHRCNMEGCNEVVKENAVVVSDDLTHDSYAVKCFVSKVTLKKREQIFRK